MRVIECIHVGALSSLLIYLSIYPLLVLESTWIVIQFREQHDTSISPKMANNILMPDYVELQKKNYSGFVVIGAGLPRTGTMSLRAALGILLDGACHHMMDVFSGTNSVYI